ncbi:hypothetical protein [Myroides marinus]|uniref:hypothetical protein n=1 Tax=Myroides marinus TaxID=703342 RepID=UPI00257856A7|nr:hypothetical protein [Myroides marinus]MDM1349906.1 hypothetical protein [Myroides marinus]MDM1357114.1 hypothetical protein [Myroides marinus]
MTKKKYKERIQISLTDFIDFVSKAGTTKFTKVKEVKNRPPYHPAFDFWKPLRERIIEVHKENVDKSEIDDVLGLLTDKNKIELYPNIIKQYKSFLGRKKVEWFEPPFQDWKLGDLRIKINPEIGLFIGDIPYVIKLYFKAEPLSKAKVDMILLMMESNLKKDEYEDAVFAVLDINKKRLYEKTSLKDEHLFLLEGEAMNFIKIWESI